MYYNKLMLYVISVIKFDCPPNPAPKASPDLLSAHQLPVHSANTWDEWKQRHAEAFAWEQDKIIKTPPIL